MVDAADSRLSPSWPVYHASITQRLGRALFRAVYLFGAFLCSHLSSLVPLQINESPVATNEIRMVCVDVCCLDADQALHIAARRWHPLPNQVGHDINHLGIQL